jgi:phage repressor protein C with HTH and peptisase S24 domain
MIDFWNRVENLRKITSLTRKELGGKIDVSPKTIDNWVARNIIPSGDKCYAIAIAMDTTVEYLFSGEELSLPDDDYVKEQKIETIQTPSGKIYCTHDNEEPTLLVPIAPQRVAAGPGQDFLPPSEYVGCVRILERMARGIDPTSLIAVSVKGDSMTGVQIFEGDMVIFAQHHISENGIYVISLYGDLKVKRLEFRSGEQRIFIHSENSRYSTEEIPMNNDNLVIMGKVVGWIHCHPY